MSTFRRDAGLAGMLAACIVMTMGTVWAFERNAPDFTVFYTAWSLVWQGRGAEIYGNSPDRFLYAPGFAWLLSPLAWLPRSAALAVWCFAKAAVVGFVVREFQRDRRLGIASMGMAAWGVVLLARPLLIDFQYGQVNILILGACCWALLGHFRGGEASKGDFGRWFVLAFAAVAKIFPLPLLVVPWLAGASVSRSRLHYERAGIAAGLALTLAIPVVSLGVPGTLSLFSAWRDALISRGVPFESHNQSFSALLHRWFSGELVHVVSLGMEPVRMGWALFSATTLHLLSFAWITLSAGVLLAWLLQAGRSSPMRVPVRWSAIAVALLILPSHLVWKPYFVMYLPIGVWIAGMGHFSRLRLVLLGAAFVLMNLLGFDLLGADWGARVEAACSMLWAGFLYLYLSATEPSPQLKS